MTEEPQRNITFVNVTPESITTRVARVIENPNEPRNLVARSGLSSELTQTLKRTNYRMEWYSKNRIDFPLGYGCTVKPWSAKLFEEVNKNLIRLIETEHPETKIHLAQVVSKEFNNHLLFDTKTNRFGYREQVERRGHWYTQISWQEKKKFLETFKHFFGFAYKFENDKCIKQYSLLQIYADSPYVLAVNGYMFVPYHSYETELQDYLPSDTLNTFYGLRFDNTEALETWKTNEIGRIQVGLFLLHHCYVICNAWKDRADYSLVWMAKKVREPHWKPNTAIVIHGKEGAGKTSHINEYGAIFGEYFIQYANLEKNLTNFSHPDQPTALLALVDEVVPSKSEQVEALTRQLITDDYFTYELKFENQRKVRNYQGVMMASNNKHPISLSEFARRYVIFDCVSTKPAKDPIHQQYMRQKLMDLSRRDGVMLKALQGFFIDPQIWLNREVYGNQYDKFGDGSVLPASIDKNLGTQRSFQQDTITSFWLACLDRGYIVAPEHNPIHPCNLKDAKNIKGENIGKEFLKYILKVCDVGYREGEDYKILDDGYKTPYHEVGHLWACFMLKETVYDSYRTHFYKMKVRGGGINPENEEKFWSRTCEIFPIMQRQWEDMTKVKLAIPQDAFTSAKLRTREHVGAEGDNIIRDKVSNVPKTVVNQTYSGILFMSLDDMRTEFKQGTGRFDIQFTNISTEMFTMSTWEADEATRSPANLYTQPYTQYLSKFGFTEREVSCMFASMQENHPSLDARILSVFQKLTGHEDQAKKPAYLKHTKAVSTFVNSVSNLGSMSMETN